MLSPSLHQFFYRQIQHDFNNHGLDEPDTIHYISDVLTRFAQTEKLYLLRDNDNKPLEHLVDMQAARHEALGSEHGRVNRVREHQILRHIGEYSLFMSGLFKQRLESRGQLDYYIANGSSAFWYCADHEHDGSTRYRLFRRLYYNFSHIVSALDRIRNSNFCQNPNDNLLQPAHALWRL